MIRLTKVQPPEILVANEVLWTEEYARLAAAERPRFARHRHPDIKQAVLTETYEKCAYCEAKMRHIAFGDVEHIFPKKHRPDLVVAWTNLTLACTVCNNGKADCYSTEAPLVHPHEDDPETHLVFLGPMVIHAPGDSKGERTGRWIRLNRVELIERRQERLESILTLVDRWQQLENPDDRELIRQEILRESSSEREFAAAVRDFLAQHLGW